MLAEATPLPHVNGQCPWCGRSALVLSMAGNVTCAHLGCDRPDAVTELLTEPDMNTHVVVLGETAFSTHHPLAERLDDGLHHCALLEWLQAHPGPPRAPGRYRATPAVGADGMPAWELERTDDAPV